MFLQGIKNLATLLYILGDMTLSEMTFGQPDCEPQVAQKSCCQKLCHLKLLVMSTDIMLPETFCHVTKVMLPETFCHCR